MITSYLKLQYKFLQRKLKEDGLNPLFIYLLATIVFYGFSTLLFDRTEYAKYIYCFFALSIALKLGDKKRNDFLKTTFLNHYKKLRVIENVLVITPFLLFLLFEQLFWYFLFLLASSILISIFNFNSTFNRTIPTPFSKQPFEFLVGFRKTFFILPIAYYTYYQSFILDDYHPGMVAILLVYAVLISYYSKVENEIFVWNYNVSPQKFLLLKVKTAIFYSSWLTLPITLALILFFPNQTLIILGIFVLGNTYLITSIFKKYSNFPHQNGITEDLLFGLSVLFPPLLLLVIPSFYSQAKKSLKTILEHD